MRMSIIAASRLRGNPFVMVVDTSKAGSASDAFQFTGALGDYDVVAKQSGVAVETFSNLSGQQTITFSNGIGIYTLEVTPKATGGFNRIEFNNSGDKLKITDITSWGNIAWSSFENAFRGASNLTGTYTDKPNLQNLTNMSLMFFQASSFNGNVTNWDVSNINTMRAMFRDCFVLNPNTSNWDVSNVTDMLVMFQGTALSTANLDGCYQNWSQLSLQLNVVFGAGTVQFTSAAQSGRNILVNTYNWTITDGGLV
jgi:hypothetical protein